MAIHVQFTEGIGLTYICPILSNSKSFLASIKGQALVGASCVDGKMAAAMAMTDQINYEPNKRKTLGTLKQSRVNVNWFNKENLKERRTGEKVAHSMHFGVVVALLIYSCGVQGPCLYAYILYCVPSIPSIYRSAYFATIIRMMESNPSLTKGAHNPQMVFTKIIGDRWLS